MITGSELGNRAPNAGYFDMYKLCNHMKISILILPSGVHTHTHTRISRNVGECTIRIKLWYESYLVQVLYATLACTKAFYPAAAPNPHYTSEDRLENVPLPINLPDLHRQRPADPHPALAPSRSLSLRPNSNDSGGVRTQSKQWASRSWIVTGPFSFTEEDFES
jgi:hypothetical protein